MLRRTLRRISQHWKKAHTLKLENCLLYWSSIISQFFDFIHWMIFDFIFIAWLWTHSLKTNIRQNSFPFSAAGYWYKNWNWVPSPKDWNPKLPHLDDFGFILTFVTASTFAVLIKFTSKSESDTNKQVIGFKQVVQTAQTAIYARRGWTQYKTRTGVLVGNF